MVCESSPLSRREFIGSGVCAFSSLALGGLVRRTVNGTAATDPLPMLPLPYPADALEPRISRRTVDLHYNRHHSLYHKTLSDYVAVRPEYRNVSLDRIVMKDGVELADTAMFAVAVLLWSHNIYWQSMKPGGGDRLTLAGEFGRAVKQCFGTLDGLKQKLLDKSRTIGIGWVWLVKAHNGLEVVWTDYQNTPFAAGRPLLALDLWEHAYYLDYQNARDRYVTVWLEHLANWEFAAANFE